MTKWRKLATEIIRIIARYNVQGIDLDKVFLFVDLENEKVEVTTSDDFTTLDKAVLFGTLSEIDPSRHLVEQDANSEFVIDCVAEMIEDADYFSEFDDLDDLEDDDDGNDDD